MSKGYPFLENDCTTLRESRSCRNAKAVYWLPRSEWYIHKERSVFHKLFWSRSWSVLHPAFWKYAMQWLFWKTDPLWYRDNTICQRLWDKWDHLPIQDLGLSGGIPDSDNWYTCHYPYVCRGIRVCRWTSLEVVKCSSVGTLFQHWCLCHSHAGVHRQFCMRRAVCHNRHRYEGSGRKYTGFPWCGEPFRKRSAYNRCFCLPLRHGIKSWYHAEIWVYGRHLTVVWVWRKDGNRFFRMRFSSFNWAFRFWSSLTCLAVRTSPSSISTIEYCLTRLPRADWKKPYSLQSCDWVLPFWWSETRDFLKSSSYIIFCIVVFSHKKPPFLCIIYCNR